MTENVNLNGQSCRYLKGVGPKVADKLAKLAINTIHDLLFHLPLHYQDRTRIYPITSLRDGDKSLIEGQIVSTEVVKGKRQFLLVKVTDNSGWLTLCFFHYNQGQRRLFEQADRYVRCFGEMRLGPYGKEMIHPEYQIVTPNNAPPLATSLTPVYPTTEGISQYQWRRMIDQALALTTQAQAEHSLPELIPGALREKYQMKPLAEALNFVHHPPKQASLQALEAGTHPAQRRLAFEELLAHQLSFFKLRQRWKQEYAPCLTDDQLLVARFSRLLPFQLTSAQQRVLQEIQHDLTHHYPMLRLLQGDVGSGKTVVAAAALVQAVSAGYQAVLMAPTEILAEQHYQNLQPWLSSLNISCLMYAGQLKAQIKRERLATIAEHQVQVVIGTHALFQQEVTYGHLGLLIVDEQHRFGVHQRLLLREKGVAGHYCPHQLIMTATPIPRTLAMTAYADLDYSVIDELPAGRQPVTTVAISNERREEVIERIRENCLQGKQTYWVCPLIEESEVLQCQAAEQIAQTLREKLPELEVGLVHGRLKTEDKDLRMKQFTEGAIDLLVATTVIEVGVDVPNASLMVIENPERLGLAQLHQLRGRIGRGQTASHCVLLYQAPLSGQAKQRLKVMRESNDGFVIAQHDMALRGAGEMLGTKQTGSMRFKVADVLRDQDILPTAQQAASQIAVHWPDYVDPLIDRWLSFSEQYSHV